METVAELKKKVAGLETQVDHLETQFSRLHDLLVDFGFDNGIYTLAESLEEAVDIEKFLNNKEQ